MSPVNPGRVAVLGVSTEVPSQADEEEESGAGSWERKRTVEALRRKGREVRLQIIAQFLSCFCLVRRWESTVIFFNEIGNRIPFASFPLQLSPSLQMK